VNDKQMNRETKVEGRGLKGWPAASGVSGSGERFAQMGALDTRPSFLDHLHRKQTQTHQNKVKQGGGNIQQRTTNLQNRMSRLEAGSQSKNP